MKFQLASRSLTSRAQSLRILLSLSARSISVFRRPGGTCGGPEPDPIPNSAVKLPCADGTKSWRLGRVGRCQVCQKRKSPRHDAEFAPEGAIKALAETRGLFCFPPRKSRAAHTPLQRSWPCLSWPFMSFRISSGILCSPTAPPHDNRNSV